MNLRSALLGAVLLAATAAPAFAQDDALISKNQTIYDAEGKRVGKVTRVLEDGSALVIYKGKVVRIGASTLTAAEGKVTTSCRSVRRNPRPKPLFFCAQSRLRFGHETDRTFFADLFLAAAAAALCRLGQ